MITTVTLNPAIDKVVEINHLSLGNVHRVANQVVSFGGKSINVARILSGLGCDTSAVCYLGKSNYEEIKDLSKKDGLNLKPIMLDGPTRTNVKIVEPDQSYRTTDLNEAGFKVTPEELKAMETLILEQGKDSDYVVLSGSLPAGIGKDFYKQMALALGKATKVIIDADGEVLMAGMEGAPFMIKPNIHELEAALGIAINSEEDIVKVCRDLIQQYGITYILVSRGEDGSVLVGEDLVLSAGIVPVEALSTVGAGDAMLAGVIYGLTQQKGDRTEQMNKALSYGVASSAIAISTQDHLVIDAERLEETASKVEMEAL